MRQVSENGPPYVERSRPSSLTKVEKELREGQAQILNFSPSAKLGQKLQTGLTLEAGLRIQSYGGLATRVQKAQQSAQVCRYPKSNIRVEDSVTL